MLHFYRRLLALRRENDCLRRGEFALLHNEDGTVLYQNTLGARKTLVACRFADSEAALPDGVPENAALLLSNYEDADTAAALRPMKRGFLRCADWPWEWTRWRLCQGLVECGESTGTDARWNVRSAYVLSESM